MIDTSEKTIEKILSRSVTDVVVRKDLEEKLKSGKKLRVKFGIDPSGFDLTLGHAVVLRKLKQFQDAGHQIILLFGTFTARIGDPTGKSKTRIPLTKEAVEKNAETYLDQASKILDIDSIEVVKNGDWLEKMDFGDVLKLAGTFTVSQMLQRDMFQDRMKNDQDINLVEFMYPLMQGYDSVPIKADVELGGNDQYFNLLAGRPIQKKYDLEPQNILTTKILVGTDGKEKMSKSLGNYIALFDSPHEIFGKVMSVPDNTMMEYFECLTDLDLEAIKAEISENPRNAKVKLAKEIITWLHDEEAAKKSEQDFIQKFVKKEIPDEMPEFSVGKSEIGILDLITKICKFAPSNGEARRMIQGGGVTFDGKKVVDPTLMIEISGEKILKVGKRKFGKITE